MKCIALIGLSLGITSWAWAGQNSRPVHRALLIGVGQYQDATWSTLSSKNDVEKISAALVAFAGFKTSEITTVLKAEETTKAGLAAALNQFVASCKSTDVVFIHYSGHGVEMDDDNGDEADGIDECLVPADAKGFERSTMISDDELAAIIAKIKAKNVTLSFDSCHSGGNTRAAARPRGKDNPNLTVPKFASAGAVKDDDFAKRGFVILSAAQSTQKAWEWQGNGVYTTALIGALSQGGANGSYRSLYEDIANRMANLYSAEPQYPVLEGDPLRKVFSGEKINPKSYYSVQAISDSLYLQAGEIHGVTADTMVALYPNGTEDFEKAKPVAQAIVKEVETSRSLLSFTPEFAAKFKDQDLGKILGATRGIIASPAVETKLLVRAEGINKTQRDTLANALPIVDFNAPQNGYDFLIAAKGTKVELQGRDGKSLQTVESTPQGLTELQTYLRKQARWKMVHDLGVNTVASVPTEMRLVRVKVKEMGQNQVEFLSAMPDALTTQLGQGDYFGIQVRAVGRKGGRGVFDPFLSVLNLMPNGEVIQLWPVVGSRQDQSKLIADGEWRWLAREAGFVGGAGNAEVQVFEVTVEGDGAGVEVFKAMSTKEFVSFQGLVDAQPGVEHRGQNTPLGKLVSSFSLGSRAAPRTPEPKTWTVATAKTLVVKK